MAIARRDIEKLFLKDAERARQRKDQAFETRLTAKDTSGGRVLETVGGAVAGLVGSGGNPLGAVAGGLSGATGKGDVLESSLKGGLAGVTTGGTTLAEFAKPENLSKLATVAEQSGAPSSAVKALQTYAKFEQSKQEKATKAASGLAKIEADKEKTSAERTFKTQTAEKKSSESLAAAEKKARATLTAAEKGREFKQSEAEKSRTFKQEQTSKAAKAKNRQLAMKEFDIRVAAIDNLQARKRKEKEREEFVDSYIKSLEGQNPKEDIEELQRLFFDTETTEKKGLFSGVSSLDEAIKRAESRYGKTLNTEEIKFLKDELGL